MTKETVALKTFSGLPGDVELDFANWKLLVPNKDLIRVYCRTNVVKDRVVLTLLCFYKDYSIKGK